MAGSKNAEMETIADAFDRQGFVSDVIIAVTDLVEDGKDAMQKNAATMIPENCHLALEQALNKVFQKVQDKVQLNFQQWHIFCETSLFSIPSSLLTLEKRLSSYTEETDVDQTVQESILDKELETLRLQLSTAQRQRSRLEMEIQSLEMWLKFKYSQTEALNDALHVLDEEDLYLIKEITRTASALKRKNAANEEVVSFWESDKSETGV